MNQISYDSIGYHIHDHSCHDQSTENSNRRLLDIHFKKGCDQRSCPCPRTRKRNSYKQQQSKELIQFDLVTLAHGTVFHLNDQTMKQFCFLQNFKNLTNKQ